MPVAVKKSGVCISHHTVSIRFFIISRIDTSAGEPDAIACLPSIACRFFRKLFGAQVKHLLDVLPGYCENYYKRVA